ncbi:hypothetical protein EDB87DRAFT_1687685 [Lactarius vividus]|nr:hypothetical protein EDB87DRAFT_1687685 [Lactarius vividus]
MRVSSYGHTSAGPWVTTIGGTTSFNPELAAEQAVSTFLQNLGNQYQGLYNPSGRGIPDISAHAVDFRLFLSVTEYESFGTSGSAPVGLFLTPPPTTIVAAIISPLNDYQLSQGLHPLDFLDMTIWRRPSGPQRHHIWVKPGLRHGWIICHR